MKTILCVLISVCVLQPSAISADDSKLRDSFRDFYTPKLADLEANYSNIRFQAAECLISGSSSIKHFEGAFTSTKFLYRSGPKRWKHTQSLEREVRSAGFQSFEEGETYGWEGEYGFQLWRPVSFEPIEQVYYHTRQEMAGGIDNLLATLVSPTLHQPYADFVENEQIEFLELRDVEIDVSQSNGKTRRLPGKILRIRDVQEPTMQSDYYFLEDSGVCVALVEYTRPYETQTIYRKVVEMSFDFKQDSRFPPLYAVHVLREPADAQSGGENHAWFIFKYERAGQIPDSEFSIEQFGFGPPVTARGVAVATSGVLLKIALVLALLLGAIVLMLFAAVFLLRKFAGARE